MFVAVAWHLNTAKKTECCRYKRFVILSPCCLNSAKLRSGFCKDDPETWKKLSATETGRYYDACPPGSTTNTDPEGFPAMKTVRVGCCQVWVASRSGDLYQAAAAKSTKWQFGKHLTLSLRAAPTPPHPKKKRNTDISPKVARKTKKNTNWEKDPQFHVGLKYRQFAIKQHKTEPIIALDGEVMWSRH